MKKLRNRFERFCFQNRNKGIPNLMLYISLGAAIVYLLSLFDSSFTLYSILCFSREKIFQGQIWRLFTYPLVYGVGEPNILLVAIGLFCYYSLGQAIENLWGTFRFNLFYLTGVLLMDAFCLIFGGYASATFLNLSLFLAYATLYPNTHFLLLFIIPVKAWVFAIIYLALIAWDCLSGSFFSLVALANYFLFFGKDVLNIIPMSWQANFRRLFRSKKGQASAGKTIPFPTAGSYKATTATVKAPYTHKCTVCGKTDISNPELEFRYCSRCQGFHCYCQEHISNHTHIE